MGIQEIYEQYHKDIQFLSIYIREAHPVDGWWLGRRFTKEDHVKVCSQGLHGEQRRPQDHRRAPGGGRGRVCAALQYGVRTYIDEMDDKVNETYAAWPTRPYLIGLDGKVVYAGGLGPYDFRPAKLKKAIEGYLG